jgi:hypothetical protein
MNVRYEVFTAVTITMMFFWVLALCELVGMVFRAEVTMHFHFSPEDGDSTFLRKLASTDQSTQRQNPEEHYDFLISRKSSAPEKI